MSLRRNLEIVWNETASPIGEKLANSGRRYIARAFSSGGTGWGVYDMKDKRFLKDREVRRLSVTDIRTPQRTLKSSDHAANEHPDFSKVTPVPYIFGYARVSTVEQSLDMQITALEEAGCTRIFTDKLSGKTAHRLQFKLMMKHLQPGDTIVVYSLSRLFRNTKHLLELFDMFKKDKITLRSLTEKSLDITTSHGRMIATVLAAVDENEVGRVRDRTIAGMAERGRQGVKFGAPPKVSPADAEKMASMRYKTGIPVPAIARKFNVSDAAVYLHTKPLAANYS